MSDPHFRLFSAQLYGSVVGRGVTGATEYHSKGCCGLQGKGCNGRESGNTSLLPAQEILPHGRQNISMLRDAWNSGYAAPPSSPTEYKTQQAHELLNLCGDLYNLQQPLHTSLMALSVPRTDPAPSQGQGPLIMHCEWVQTGWTQKQNNLPLGQWSDPLKME